MSIRTRIALTFGILVVLVAAVTGLGVYTSLANGIDYEVDRALLSAARSFAEEPPPPGSPGAPSEGAQRPPTPKVIAPGVVVERVEPNGEVKQLGLTRDVTLDTSVLAPPTVTEGVEAESITNGNQTLRVLSVPDSFGRGIVRAVRDISYVGAALQEARRMAIVISLVGGLLAALLGWLLAALLVRPLQRLTATASSIATTGATEQRVVAEGSSETTRLATAFNDMLDSLSAARAAEARLLEDAAHELRTPLTSIRTNAAMLEQFEELSRVDQAALIADLQAESAELGDLVEQTLLLTTARVDMREERVDLAELAKVTVERMQRAGLRVTVSGSGQVDGDPVLLRRAIVNLIGNAAKFAPDGEIEVSVTQVEGLTFLTVADDGPGFTEGTQSLVFQRFWRDEQFRHVNGSGLGLAIVADIAERHGGNASATNGAGGGAVITLRLPAVK